VYEAPKHLEYGVKPAIF